MGRRPGLQKSLSSSTTGNPVMSLSRRARVDLPAAPRPRMTTRLMRLLYKDRFWHHYVNALVAVDQLGNVHVAGDAGQHVSIVAGQVLGADEEIDHLAHGNARGLMQLRMKAHADVMRGRFRARIFLSRTFVHDELKRTDQ